ncbi:MAG: hypothetical protein KatS3mg052_1405 [Candidatus Roseilinea sp.]|nr:MAG: hypothetical protein KatS3mg052_1405 [Candidatus Roseilinea sp.]
MLRHDASRWQAETDCCLLKQRLGLANFRLRSVEAVLRWFALVFVAYAFIRARIAERRLKQPDPPALSFQDVIAEQERWHLERLIVFAADGAILPASRHRSVALAESSASCARSQITYPRNVR